MVQEDLKQIKTSLVNSANLLLSNHNQVITQLQTIQQGSKLEPNQQPDQSKTEAIKIGFVDKNDPGNLNAVSSPE